ncbi:MAG: FHA domain-containing protein [Planctomycetes bacterium]|nr:FHA domain-containing protein [Planctomycetota bacterium]
MKVKLRVRHGSNAGRELPIQGPHFIIGRGDGCHLKAKSDMISRRHCAVIVGESQVAVRDLKSKNGTLVNGEPIQGQHILQSEDVLQVGPLEFDVLIDHALGAAAKRPKVETVKEAAARTAGEPQPDDIESDITSWLEEADELDRLRRTALPETRQFKLDDTQRFSVADPNTGNTVVDEAALKDTMAEKSKRPLPDMKKPGKLPKSEGPQSADTREAASETLKKLFKRR